MVCPIHGNYVLMSCWLCRHGLEVRRRQLQLGPLENFLLSLSPSRIWALAIAGAGIVLFLALVLKIALGGAW